VSYPHGDDFTQVLASEEMFNGSEKPFTTRKTEDQSPVFIVREHFDAQVLYIAITAQVDRLCMDLSTDFRNGVDTSEMIDHLFRTAETLKHLSNMAKYLRQTFDLSGL
jgi:hypothetical protein